MHNWTIDQRGLHFSSSFSSLAPRACGHLFLLFPISLVCSLAHPLRLSLGFSACYHQTTISCHRQLPSPSPQAAGTTLTSLTSHFSRILLSFGLNSRSVSFGLGGELLSSCCSFSSLKLASRWAVVFACSISLSSFPLSSSRISLCFCPVFLLFCPAKRSCCCFHFLAVQVDCRWANLLLLV